MPDAAIQISGGRIALVIIVRELRRFVRQPARVAGAVGTPILLWVFLASGFADAMRSDLVDGVSYTTFLLPGMMSLVAVFAAVLSAMSVIEDRQAGWLQAALVSPAPRWSLAMGQVLGSAVIAFIQAAVLMLALPMLGLAPSLVEIAMVLLALFATALAMASLGIIFAWRVESAAGFHAVMNLLFMPMWLLSGAFLPTEGAAPWFAAIVELNPLTWCTEAIRQPLLGGPWLGHLVMACAFAALSAITAMWEVSRQSSRAL